MPDRAAVPADRSPPPGVAAPAGALLVMLAALATLFPAAALITSFSAGVLVDENTASPQSADYATQAGGHPDVAFTKFTLDTTRAPPNPCASTCPRG